MLIKSAALRISATSYPCDLHCSAKTLRKVGGCVYHKNLELIPILVSGDPCLVSQDFVSSEKTFKSNKTSQMHEKSISFDMIILLKILLPRSSGSKVLVLRWFIAEIFNIMHFVLS